MRVRYAMADTNNYKAECDLTKAKARNLFNRLKENQYCCWAELVAEEPEEGGYMEIIDGFDHNDAHKLYKTKLEMQKILQEIFG